MEFIIDRSKWRSGMLGDNAKGIGEETLLLNDKGGMCCLGFVSEQCGVPRKLLFGAPEPRALVEEEDVVDLENVLLYFDDDLDIWQNTVLTNRAMVINDDEFTTSQEKEKQLITLFKENGHTIKFEGKPVKLKK